MTCSVSAFFLFVCLVCSYVYVCFMYMSMDLSCLKQINK